MIDKTYDVGIYCHLSNDDERDGESVSIENQKLLLQNYVRQRGWNEVDVYIDDGYSGTNFNRPGVQRLIEDAKAKRINLILVKDLSRFGRNYIEFGQYTDYLFPSIGCRFIALNNGIDTMSDNGSTDVMCFLNLFNDFYAKDTSKKVRAIKRAQGQAGEHLTKPPYGYMVSPTDKKQWIVDDEAAAVVKRIFDLCIGGKGPMQIAKILKEDKVLTAKAHYAKKKGKPFPENPYDWRDSTIVGILERMDYCGHTVNFKSYSKSHKLKKRIPTTKEQQSIFFNTHEAIVEDAVFERVQELRANKRRPTKAERQALFSGLVYCADCGSKLHFVTCKSFNGSQDHYRCAKYKSNTESCTAHFIREEVLKQIVWSRIFDVTALFFDDIMAFHEMMYQQRSAETEKEMKRRKREVEQARKRIAELDRIFKRIYEDDISGAISHDRFLKLSAEYEAEQRELEEKVKADQQEVDTYEQNKSDFDSFAAIIRKYVGIKELTPAIVNEFIKKIIVHAPEKVNGKRVQKVDIVFNFVGEINFLSATQPKRQGA